MTAMWTFDTHILNRWPAYLALYRELEEALDGMAGEEKEELANVAGRSLAISAEMLGRLQRQVQESGFSDTDAEIEFFKMIKPRFYAPVLFFQQVYGIELRRPVGSPGVIQGFIEKELEKLTLHYEEYSFLYQYYRSGAAHADGWYFTRSLPGVSVTDPIKLVTDPVFSTGYDLLFAQIAANEQLSRYLTDALVSCNSMEGKTSTIQLVPARDEALEWTGPIVDIVELAKGLKAHGCVNNGKVADKALVAALGRVFNIKVDHVHKKYEEIRLRKKNRTVFWDGGKRSLLRQMEQDDEYAA
jgi:hypothetical protein